MPENKERLRCASSVVREDFSSGIAASGVLGYLVRLLPASRKLSDCE